MGFHTWGQNNQVRRQAAYQKYDPDSTSALDVLRQIAAKQFDFNIFSSVEGFRGVCLRVYLQSSDATANSWLSAAHEPKTPDSKEGEETTDESDTVEILPQDQLLSVKVMIPEVHAYLCNPFGFSGENCTGDVGIDQGIVDMYPTFIAKTSEASIDIPSPGDIVAVDFGNRDMMTDPIYKGRVFSNPVGFESIKLASSGFASCPLSRPTFFQNTENYFKEQSHQTPNIPPKLFITSPPLGRDLYITSPYGPRTQGDHKGWDLRAKPGTEVKAVADGTFEYAKWDKRGGWYIKLKHTKDGSGGNLPSPIYTFYMHLGTSSATADKDKAFNNTVLHQVGGIKAGQVIGWSGTTPGVDAHLHFEIKEQGFKLDPRSYFDLANMSYRSHHFKK